MRTVLRGLQNAGLPVFVIDDGSTPSERMLAGAACRETGATFIIRPQNGGKGAAVKDGFRVARDAGYTHALQIDADGQHNLGDLPQFLAAAEENPEALILAAPVYGRDAPAGRLIGRQISRVWVWIETLSFTIRDPLIGYRVYPLAPALEIADAVGDRMSFDLDYAVRLRWAGVPVLNVTTPVRYPEGGVSHFHMVRDNLAISRAHTRLFFGMLRRLPLLLQRKFRS